MTGVEHEKFLSSIRNNTLVEYLRAHTPSKDDWFIPQTNTAEDQGDTAMHLAALTGHISQVPKELVTEANLLVSNFAGLTTLHCLAISGSLGQIPQKFLTPRALTTEDQNGWTPLHCAAYEKHAAQIPQECHI